MKVVYNNCYTGFRLPKEFLGKHPEYNEYDGAETVLFVVDGKIKEY